MNSCMKCDVWFDNPKILQRYILWYTVGNPINHVLSLFTGWHLVLFSEQRLPLWANSSNFLTKQMIRKQALEVSSEVLKLTKCIRRGFFWGGVLLLFLFKFCFVAPLRRCHKTKFPTVKPTIYLQKMKIFNTVIPSLSCSLNTSLQ